MDRTFRSLAAVGALALTSFAAPAPSVQAEPPVRPAQDIEVFRGSERSVVRAVRYDSSLREERGVLGTRGVQAGAAGVAPDALVRLDRPARARARTDLEAIARVYAEVFGLGAAPALAVKLSAGEPLHVPHRQAAASTPLPPGREQSARTRHDASHAFVHALAPHAPAWLDEGLACYFEGLERRPAGEIRVRANAGRHGTLRRLARTGELPSLAQLGPLSPAHLADDAASAASWSLVFSLMQTPKGRDVLLALFEGAAPRSVAARLAELRVGEPSALPRIWRRTASGALASQILIPAQTPVAPEQDTRTQPRATYSAPLRCVRGVLGAGTPQARPTLFCSRSLRPAAPR